MGKLRLRHALSIMCHTESVMRASSGALKMGRGSGRTGSRPTWESQGKGGGHNKDHLVRGSRRKLKGKESKGLAKVSQCLSQHMEHLGQVGAQADTLVSRGKKAESQAFWEPVSFRSKALMPSPGDCQV